MISSILRYFTRGYFNGINRIFLRNRHANGTIVVDRSVKEGLKYRMEKETIEESDSHIFDGGYSNLERAQSNPESSGLKKIDD
ncbi:hypothetical protein KM043_016170 [Ampulex compressa]|nr:hypothetical protein KM043_016170 [Ampulex compressa]